MAARRDKKSTRKLENLGARPLTGKSAKSVKGGFTGGVRPPVAATIDWGDGTAQKIAITGKV